jgi:hypothetical protein
MFVDMIKTVYDSNRVERIIGRDGTEKLVEINKEDPNSGDIMNDLTKGEYDVEVTIGPSFQSARQEALDTLIAFAEAMPQSVPLIQDLIAKNIDSPDAQEMANRLRIPLIQQGIIQPNEKEKQAGVGKPTPQQQQAQQKQQQLEQLQLQLLQGKTQKMGADATIAQSRAQASPLEQEKVKFEVAGKHLANIKLAHEIKADGEDRQNDAQSARMELATKHVGHLQDLAAQHVENLQGLKHASDQHLHDQQVAQHSAIAEAGAANEKHEAEMRRAAAAHEAEMRRAHEKHALTLQHQKELNEQKVAAAKAVAAAKPKKSKKAT